MKFLVAGAALLACLSQASLASQVEKISAEAQAIHARALVLDSHLDTPMLFARPGWSIMHRHSADADFSYVDYPRMLEGGLDGGFWAIWTEQGARDVAGKRKARDAGLRRLMDIREMVAANRDHFEIALRADDARRIVDSGKRVVFISMENSSPLATDPSLVETYYRLGLRMLGLVHSSNNDFADSATNPDGAEFHGLSDKGRALVAEANRLGLIIDLSHSSNDTFDQVLELSRAPVVLSHSSAAALNPHPRNIDDARIRKLAEKGGVIQVNSVSSFLVKTPKDAERDKAMDEFWALVENSPQLTPERLRSAMQIYHRIEKEYPQPMATFDDFMKHLLHIIKVAGPEHVGLGADWDGGGGVTGMEDIASLPRITERLLKEGYSEAQIDGILGGNVLRVMRQVEAVAAH